MMRYLPWRGLVLFVLAMTLPFVAIGNVMPSDKSSAGPASPEDAATEAKGVSRALASEAAGLVPKNERSSAFEPTPGVVLGSDDRQLITPTTSEPWRAIASLEVEFDSGMSLCTGFFIGPDVVATAGHCVYDFGGDGWANAIRVIPGHDGPKEPFGAQFAITGFTNEKWTEEGDGALDFGGVILPDSTLGDAVGWFRYGSLNDDGALGITGAMANLAGYPGDSPVLFQQWFHSEDITATTFEESIVCNPPDPCVKIAKGVASYLIDTAPGQSGSPVWLYNGGQRAVVAIHTAGPASGRCFLDDGLRNCGTLMTQSVADIYEEFGAKGRLPNVYPPIFPILPIAPPFITEPKPPPIPPPPGPCPLDTPDFSFNVPDPLGDAFGFGAPTHDIINVAGEGDATTFCLTVEFNGPVDPADAGTGQEVIGFIDFDTDQNPVTGLLPSNVTIFCPNPSGMGVDVFVEMFSVSGGMAPLFPSGELVPVQFDTTSFTVGVPLSALGGDSNFNVGTVLGSFLEPTDCAPFDGGCIVSPTGDICSPTPPPPPPPNCEDGAPMALSSPGVIVLDATYTGDPEQCAIFGKPLQGFPTNDGSFLALSTGNASVIPAPLSPPASSWLERPAHADLGPANVDPFDVAELSVTVAVPPGATTLSFDWKFGTDESFGGPFQDFFDADGLKATVDSTFPISSCPPVPADVNFGCFVTDVQTHSIDVTGLSQYKITFKVGDSGDSGVDSVAFIDNLRFDAPSGKVKIRAGSATVPPGGTITIPVDALLNPPTINQGTFTVEVKYDTSLLTGVSCTSDPNALFDFSQCNEVFAPGVARCTGVSISGLSGAELSLCDIDFRADTDAPFGTSTPLVVNCIVKTDPGGVPIPCNEENGKITIGLQGDVNCDGFVNVVDALFILQFEVGLRVDSGGCPLPPPPPDTLNAAGGDVNKDEFTNVVDALFILQCEVGLKPGANMPFCTNE